MGKMSKMSKSSDVVLSYDVVHVSARVKLAVLRLSGRYAPGSVLRLPPMIELWMHV